MFYLPASAGTCTSNFFFRGGSNDGEEGWNSLCGVLAFQADPCSNILMLTATQY
jgi:hypothetical protein